MAIHTLYQNTLCRIEVRFQPGIPRIEILGSSAKPVKDAAIKAKLLLVQMGYRFPRNKKIYVCIDPFVNSHQGLDLPIFAAMKQALENIQTDNFVYGDLSFNGVTSSDQNVESILPYVPNKMSYWVGNKQNTVFQNIPWKIKNSKTKISWLESASPLMLAAVQAKESVLLIIDKNFSGHKAIQDLQEIFFQWHHEPIEIVEDLHLKKKLKTNSTFIATLQVCPCGDIEAWQRKTCAKTAKQCGIYTKDLEMLSKCNLVLLIKNEQSVEKEIKAQKFPIAADIRLPNSLKERERNWILNLLSFIPTELQFTHLEKIFEAKKHQRKLLGNWLR